MAIVSNLKVFSDTLFDVTNTYYSDSRNQRALGGGEQFWVEVKTSNVNGASMMIFCTLETSDDGMNWSTAYTFPNVNNKPISSGTILVDSSSPSTLVVGRFGRITFKLGGTGAVGAYVECWVTSRDAT
jgi:hypothetical protein